MQRKIQTDINLRELFAEKFPTEKSPKSSFCPYRVCPIGAHVDHQYGKVLGFALDKGMKTLYAPSDNDMTALYSTAFPDGVSFSVNDIPKKQNDWADYLRGATLALSGKYTLSRGIKAVIHGSMPIGGLSSSAAVIISFLSALCEANGITLSENETVLTAQKAENVYVGIGVGKLDQSCEVLCRKKKLLYLDTKDDSYVNLSAGSGIKPYKIAVFFSGIKRTLVGSAYNARVDELKAASYALKAFSGMEYGRFADSRLRDVSEETFKLYENKLPINWRKRALHYYTEIGRVEKGAELWQTGDIEGFGRLSAESGESSIGNYEAGSPELIALHKIINKTDGVYGGRFSGAGFKGCCMALIDPAFAESIEKVVTLKYLRKFPALRDNFKVYFCDTADGTGSIGKRD